MKKYICIFLCAGMFLLAGCEKKQEPVSQPQTPAESVNEQVSVPETSETPEAEIPEAETPVAKEPQIIDLTQETFDSFIQSDEKVLVDFWAPWCPPCRRQGELLHQWSEEGKLPPKVRVGKVNVDEQKELAKRFDVHGIPSLFIFQKGEMVQHFLGLQSEEVLLEALK